MSEFDNVAIYLKYPVLKPFVGENYKEFNPKVLFIGESHYLPQEWNNKINTEWYNQSLERYNFSEKDLAYLNTFNIIKNDVINCDHKNPSHSIYRNIGDVFGSVFKLGSYKNSLNYISYYNYFPRPAEFEGGSINNDWFSDNQVSFQTLIEINKILNPKYIIFVSKKAKKAFDSIYYSENYTHSKDIDTIKISQIPHPSSAWWNKPAKNYDNLSGKEFLTQIFEK